jgi:hypothetical protein
MRNIGPNHQDSCGTFTPWTYSGSGYNRVQVCACGAEDHDPEIEEQTPIQVKPWSPKHGRTPYFVFAEDRDITLEDAIEALDTEFGHTQHYVDSYQWKQANSQFYGYVFEVY